MPPIPRRSLLALLLWFTATLSSNVQALESDLGNVVQTVGLYRLVAATDAAEGDSVLLCQPSLLAARSRRLPPVSNVGCHKA